MDLTRCKIEKFKSISAALIWQVFKLINLGHHNRLTYSFLYLNLTSCKIEYVILTNSQLQVEKWRNLLHFNFLDLTSCKIEKVYSISFT